MSIHGIDGKNDGSYLANWLAQGDAQIKKNQEAFAASPQGLAMKAKKEATAKHKEGAKAAYASGGDQALADYYLNADPKIATRAETNPAKQVKEGKTTFANAAQKEIERYNASQASVANANQLAGPLQNTFQFVIDNPYNPEKSTPDTPTTQPYTPSAAAGSQAPDPKETWQQAQEKAGLYKQDKAYQSNWNFQPGAMKEANKNKEGDNPYSFTPW